MSLSKPLMNLGISYLQNLYMYPIRTKSLTSCFLSASANVSSQLISGEKHINLDSVLAFAGFGLFFGGPLPHFFYQALEKTFPRNATKYGLIRQLLIERIVYMPLFQALSLYVISRFEGKDHKTALRFMHNLIQKVVHTNWKYLTIFQIINLTVVPPVLRVLFVNIIGFFWVMYVAKKRRNEAAKSSSNTRGN